ncbi:hypothetical protein [Sphingomonas sp. T9W2]|jgi:hypothetical protein|uniref:hypothetical protein n=1 Tax=Sphingomonas sp. T9W2 TaxID=3143183 RepID=UPI0031F4D3EA
MQNQRDGARLPSPIQNSGNSTRRPWGAVFGVIDAQTASLIVLVGIPTLSFCILTSG